MKTIETIYTETDAQGRIIKRTHTIEKYPSNTDKGYDYGTKHCGCGCCHEASMKRIFEAHKDYRASQQW